MSKILVIDDDVSHLKSMVYFLVKNIDCDVLSATTGNDAINIVKGVTPDLILIDWSMPEMSGIETIMEMKNNVVLCDIPIIMMSGLMLTASNLKTAMHVGAVDYLRKPIEEVELVARVCNMLRLSEMQKQLRSQNLLLQNQLTSLVSSHQFFEEQKKSMMKMLTEIKSFLSNGALEMPKDLFDEFDRLLNEREFNWTDFQTNFEFIHCDFFKRVKQLYPGLTKAELRMCAFIRLNMTNKDIAAITCISPDSVNTARKRLKRKMKVDSGVNLADTLMNL